MAKYISNMKGCRASYKMYFGQRFRALLILQKTVFNFQIIVDVRVKQKIESVKSVTPAQIWMQ
jgi:hypothetical protein